MQGCRLRDHMVKLSSNSKADSGKSKENSVYDDLLAHRDVVCLPQLRFGGTVINEYAVRYCDIHFVNTFI